MWITDLHYSGMDTIWVFFHVLLDVQHLYCWGARTFPWDAIQRGNGDNLRRWMIGHGMAAFDIEDGTGLEGHMGNHEKGGRRKAHASVRSVWD